MVITTPADEPTFFGSTPGLLAQWLSDPATQRALTAFAADPKEADLFKDGDLRPFCARMGLKLSPGLAALLPAHLAALQQLDRYFRGHADGDEAHAIR